MEFPKVPVISKKPEKNLVFICILSVTDEKSRIRIWIRIPIWTDPRIRNQRQDSQKETKRLILSDADAADRLNENVTQQGGTEINRKKK